MTAKIPTITTTIMSSIKVNPLLVLILHFMSELSLRILLHDSWLSHALGHLFYRHNAHRHDFDQGNATTVATKAARSKHAPIIMPRWPVRGPPADERRFLAAQRWAARACLTAKDEYACCLHNHGLYYLRIYFCFYERPPWRFSLSKNGATAPPCACPQQ